MIDLYSGTPGSGKSLHVAKDIYEQIKYHDRPCIGNFIFNGDCLISEKNKKGGYLYLSNEEVNPSFLFYFSEYYKKEILKKRIPEEHILLVIDEAQLLFNAREWNRPDRKSWVSFFTQHRKLGYHIVLIAQYADMLDKQVRAVLEYEYIHRKVSNIGKGGGALSLVSGGGLHIFVKMYVPLKLKVGSSFFRADPSLFSLYDSYTLFA